MKKAEEYFKFMSSEDDIINLYEDSKTDFINAVKQAQIDAIEEAVSRCAENALCKSEVIPIHEKCGGIPVNTTTKLHFVVDSNSILDVANQLKQELG